MITEFSLIAVQEFFRRWRDSYQRRPVLTVILTVIGLMGLATVIYLGQRQQEKLEQERLENLDLQQQLEELNEVQRSLNNLLAFVEDQQTRIATQQDVIASLEQQRTELEPLVEADREVVEALLNLQEQRTRRQRFWDIVLGFVLALVIEILVAVVIAPRLIPTLHRRNP